MMRYDQHNAVIEGVVARDDRAVFVRLAAALDTNVADAAGQVLSTYAAMLREPFTFDVLVGTLQGASTSELGARLGVTNAVVARARHRLGLRANAHVRFRRAR